MRNWNRIVAVVSCSASLAIASVAFAEQSAHLQEQPGSGKLVEAPAHFRDVHPPLFFHEEWKAAPGAKEAPITQDAVGNPNLELKLYGDPKDILLSGAAGKPDDPLRVWTGTCEGPCGVALRDKNNYADLTGLAKIRWSTRVSGFHKLRPIVKLADGNWLVGDRADGEISDEHVTEFSISDVRWLRLDIDKVVAKGSWLVNPDLSKVDEVGFVDLMPGSGHGQGGYSTVSQFTVYGKAVNREGSAQNQPNH